MKKQSLLVLTAYLLLTILMTWPAALYLSSGIPGDGFDGWQNYWNLWWVKQALLVEQTNPYFTTYLDAPAGVSLLFHTLNIFNGLWTLPVQLNWGLAVAYNSVVLAGFTLAGYGAYLLALFTLAQIFPRRRGLRPAAFVAGLIFTMSPFHMAHLLGHMQVFSMIWPPFYIWALLRALQPWQPAGSPPPARQWRSAACASLFLGLATLVDWYHTLYLLMFTGLTLVWVLWRNRLHNSFFRPILVTLTIGVSFAVLLSPLLLPMIRDASHRPDLETGLAQNITLSADVLAFVLPSELHPLWGRWAAGIAGNFTSTTSERLVFAGFAPLALAAVALFWGWRHAAVKFWGLAMAVFTVLALGPYLHIYGQVMRLGNWPLPLPYLLLYYTVPFINLTRSLSRYDLMIMLGLGILAAAGLARLNPKNSVWLPVAAAIIICFEFLPAPYPVSKIDTPQFYIDRRADTADYTIAELPMNWDRPTPLLYQTVHGKRLLTAYTSRDNPRLLATQTPVFQQWRNLGPDIIDQPLAEIAPTIFYDFNLRYIVLDYWQMPPGPERDRTEHWVAAALPNAAPVYADGRLKVFQTPPKTETRPYLSLGAGWSRRVENSQVVTRTISLDGAELFAHHLPAATSLQLEITAAGPTLQLLVDGQSTPDEIELTPEFTAHIIPLPAGEHSLLKLKLLPAAPPTGVTVSRISLTPAPKS